MKIRYKNIDYLVMGICYFKNNKESHYLIEEKKKKNKMDFRNFY